MKKLVLAILTFTISSVVISQPCSGFYFYSQAQIDSFPIKNPHCSEILGDIRIYGNDITNLNGLHILNSIQGDLAIGWVNNHNPILTSITGLENITTLNGNLSIRYNDILSNLNGLEGLDSIGGSLYINDNPCLPSLEGLNNITSIGGELDISWCEGLTRISELSNLTSIGHNLWIRFNGSLENLNGLGNLTSIPGQFTFMDNINLTSLSGLDNITSIGADVWIEGNDSLEGFNNLGNLTSIGMSFTIRRHELLTDLSGLTNLETIGGFLSILDNQSLITLQGLDHINNNSITDLYIKNNILLSHCAIQSICNYLTNPIGTKSIYNNATGCNSPYEVQDSCEANAVTIVERYMLQECMVSPNPFTISTTFSYTLNKPSSVTISIFNPQGQLIENIEQDQPKGQQQVQWNSKGLRLGMYYFRIQTGDKVGGGKMVLMN